jgi:hypothetical protein
MESGDWRLEDGRWRMEGGGWRIELELDVGFFVFRPSYCNLNGGKAL